MQPVWFRPDKAGLIYIQNKICIDPNDNELSRIDIDSLYRFTESSEWFRD